MAFIATSIQQRDIRAIEIGTGGTGGVKKALALDYEAFWHISVNGASAFTTMGYLLVIFSSFIRHLGLKSFHIVGGRSELTFHSPRPIQSRRMNSSLSVFIIHDLAGGIVEQNLAKLFA